MKPNLFNLFAAGLLLAFASGCSTTHHILPSPVLEGNHWDAVLKQHVNPAGQINFDALKQEPEQLIASAFYVADHQPDKRTTANETLAFYLNGYNTLAMYHAVHARVKPEQKIRFFLLSKLPIEGKAVSLYTLENKLIRPLGDPRIHFALNCMVRDCPRLLQVPYRAQTLDEQLDAAAREFLNSEKHIRVNAENSTVHCSRILKWYRKDFETAETNLLQYINRYREQKIPEDYKIAWLPYDWALNSWE
jgi:hypothetical protein